MDEEERAIIETAFGDRMREGYYDGEIETLKHKVEELEKLVLILLLELEFSHALDLIHS